MLPLVAKETIASPERCGFGSKRLYVTHYITEYRTLPMIGRSIVMPVEFAKGGRRSTFQACLDDHRKLITDAQLGDSPQVQVPVLRVKVLEQGLALPEDHEQTPLGSVVLLVLLQVPGQLLHAGAEAGNLAGGASGVRGALLEGLDLGEVCAPAAVPVADGEGCGARSSDGHGHASGDSGPLEESWPGRNAGLGGGSVGGKSKHPVYIIFRRDGLICRFVCGSQQPVFCRVSQAMQRPKSAPAEDGWVWKSCPSWLLRWLSWHADKSQTRGQFSITKSIR